LGLRLDRESRHALEDANSMYVDYVLTSRPALVEKLRLVCTDAERLHVESSIIKSGREVPTVAG
jgi:hypothetical protein